MKKHFVLSVLLVACASKDFRSAGKSVLVCSTIANSPDSDQIKIFRTHPVQWSWDELSRKEIKVFRHDRTLKAFIPHKFAEDPNPHQAIIVWNFDLEKGYDSAFIKRGIKKHGPELHFNNMFDPPALKHAIFTGGDLIVMNKSGIKDKNYDQGHLVHTFNRTTILKEPMQEAEAGEFCLKRLEDDPPQVQEEEEFKLENLKSI